ncbi:MAG: DMT family transporter [Spirochaetes bacterium]|nr:DMT family transporter [Spirochaetota bacterium]
MSTSAERWKGVLYVNVATFAWATNILIGRTVRNEIGPMVLTVGRYLVASFVFYLLLARRSPEERKIGKDFLLLTGMAITGVVVFAPLLYYGLRFTTAVNGTLINGVGPLLTAVFAAILIHEPFSIRQILGSILAFGGVGILIGGIDLGRLRNAQWNVGDLWILLAVGFWALYSVFGRRVMKNRSALSATAISMWIGLPMLLVVSFVELNVNPPQWSLRLLGVLVYLGIVPAALGFFAWNKGVQILGAGGAMVFYNMLPLYGSLLGILLLKEPFTWPQLIGGGCIIAGGLIAARRK